MITYIKLKSESGYEISFGIKLKKYLVINTNFNPFTCHYFSDVYLLKVPEISHLVNIGKYDDGTGFLVFVLHPNYNYDSLVAGVMNEFQSCFFKNVCLADLKK